MRTKNFFLTLLLAAMISVPAHLGAQVTIGGTNVPNEFSMLEIMSRDERGLRLPQMTTQQRNDMQAGFGALADTEARGLQIFNTDTRCVEVWNGRIWISMCTAADGAVIPPEFCDTCFPGCPDENPLRGFTAVHLNDGMPHPQSFTFQGAAGTLNQNHISFNMMPVTGGVFVRGAQSANPDCPNYISASDPFGAPQALAAPIHQVAVNSFFIGQSQVTRELFMAVMAFSGTVNGHTLTPLTTLLAATDRPDGTALTTPNHPRNRVNWYEAVVFMNRLSAIMGRDLVYVTNNNAVTGANLLNPPSFPTNNAFAFCAIRDSWDIAVSKHPDWLNRNGFRLPTETEWEYAARGGQQNEYTRTFGASGTQLQWSGGNNINAIAWWGHPPAGSLGGNSGAQAHPVMLLQPNELGIFDMTGNVWDWCWDWLSTYNNLCFLINPTGDPRNAGGTNTAGLWNRVHRGGSWSDTPAFTRVSIRGFSSTPAYRHGAWGIRIASSTN